MRVFLFLCIVGILSMPNLFWGSANGQYFEDPTRHFKIFEFDQMNRGSFNISTCMKDLMTCLELVKPDIICMHNRVYETVCGTTRSVCHDYYGDYDTYGFRFQPHELICDDYGWS